MISSCLSRVVRAVGVALVPAVVVLGCADRAAAGCGEYVRILDPDGTAQQLPRHDPEPCRGPFCHGGPKAPAPVPPATVSAPDSKGLAAPVAAAGARTFLTRRPPAG